MDIFDAIYKMLAIVFCLLVIDFHHVWITKCYLQGPSQYCTTTTSKDRAGTYRTAFVNVCRHTYDMAHVFAPILPNTLLPPRKTLGNSYELHLMPDGVFFILITMRSLKFDRDSQFMKFVWPWLHFNTGTAFGRAHTSARLNGLHFVSH